MSVSKELINIINQMETVELIRLPSAKERDSILALKPHTETMLNVANLDKYMDYPRTIPIVYRKNGKIIGLIVGVPIENYHGDDTFPDPDMNKRNTVYTIVFQYNDSKIAKQLESEYLVYLKRHNIKSESRHMRLSWTKGTDFEQLEVFDEWRVGGSKICYCKRRIDNV